MFRVAVDVRRYFSAAVRAALFGRLPDLPTGRRSVLVAMLFVAAIGSVAAEWVLADDDWSFNAHGLTYLAATWATLAFGLYLLRGPDRPIDIVATVCLACALSTIFMAVALGSWALMTTAIGAEGGLWLTMLAGWMLLLAPFIWFVASAWHAGRSITRQMPRRLGVALPMFMIALPSLVFPYNSVIFGTKAEAVIPTVWDVARFAWPAEREAVARYRAPRFDVEAVWDRQPELVARTLADVAPSRPGIPEFYFVGGALYSSQDVFKREVASARQIVEEQLGTKARSALLINHREFAASLPVASTTNIEKVLAGVGKIMDPDKDVLVLFLTSHGSEGLLSVSYPMLGLNDMTPERLASMLDASGIKNRVVIISACHSGSFIDALKGPDTLVITAAHASKTSFGCSNEREWTYFGDAYFNYGLRETGSLTEAFGRAVSVVGSWEANQKLTPSDPQMLAGERIVAHLAAIDKQRKPVTAALQE